MTAEVKKSVVIELQVVASDTAQATAKSVQSAVDKVYAGQVSAHKSAMDRITKQEDLTSSQRVSIATKSATAAVSAISRIDAAEKKAFDTQQRRRATQVQSAKEAFKEEISGAKKLGAEIDNLQGRIENVSKLQEAHKTYVDAQSKVQSGQKALGESTKQVLEGSVSIAQGFVTLGLVGEENLEKVVKGLVKVQGAFSIIRGGITLFFAVREAMVAWKAVTIAQTEANIALAASQGLVNKVSAGGGAAGAASTGAAGAATGAAGGAVGGGLARKSLGGMAVLVAKASAVALVATESFNLLRRSLGDTSKSSESLIGAIRGWWRATADSKESTERLTKAEQARQKNLDLQRERNEQIAKAGQVRSGLNSASSSIRSRLGDATGATDGEKAENARLIALSQIEKAEAEVAAARERSLDRQRRGQFALSEDAKQAAEFLKSATEQRVDAEQRINEAAKSRLETQRQLVEQTKSELQTANDRVAAEEKASQSKLARFGQLGRGDQARIRGISNRVQSGKKINQNDAEFLQKTGLGGDLAQDFFANKGAKQGGAGTLAGLGEFDAHAKAIDDRNKLAADLAKQTQESIKIENDLAVVKKRYIEALLKLAELAEQQVQAQAEGAGAVGGRIGGVSVDISREIGDLTETIKEALRQSNRDFQASLNGRQASGGVV